ncbi:cadmium-translocating P-type ATPase [bacterium]|nr:cadmium-translocating P-type ATPase [bacterium]
MSKESCHHCAPSIKNKPAPEPSLRVQFWGSLLCTVPVAWLAMKNHLGHGAIQWGLTSVSLFGFGGPIWKKAWVSVKALKPNMFTLIAVGLLSAYGLSVWLFFHSDASGFMGFYFEGATMLLSMVLLGQVLEAKAGDNTQQALGQLTELIPSKARLVVEGSPDQEIAVEAIQLGNHLRVLPGTQIPVDGRIVDGASAVDESWMTGESQPIEKKVGDFVLAGTLNQLGSFVFVAEKTGTQTLLAHVIDWVAELQAQKVPIQKLVDRISAVFTPLVFVFAAITGLVWWIFGSEPGNPLQAIVPAISVLMVACPCALGLATPIAILVGTARAARSGILFRNLESVQIFEKIDTIVFDKTGTLTQGRPQVVSSQLLDKNLDTRVVWRQVASLERASEHPLASAVLDAAGNQGISQLDAVENFRSFPGLGITGSVGGQTLLIGNPAFLKDQGIATEEVLSRARSLEDQGQTVLWVAIEKRCVFLIGVQDQIRPEAPSMIRAFKHRGLKLLLASGDQPSVTQKIATQLEISEWEGGLLPHQKAETIRRLQSQGRTVCFLGDGINDAPALTQADLGIAMGTGTDIARQSASITLIKGNLSALFNAFELSRLMMRNIRQNLFWAFSYNLVGIPLAAGAFYPIWGLKLTPVFSSMAMTISSLLVVGNSLRLRFQKFRNAE